MSNIAALAAALAAGGLSYLAIGKAFGTGAPQPAAKRENRGGKAFKAFSAAVSRALPQSRTASLDAGAALRAAGLKATPDDWHAARLAAAGIAAALGAAVGAAASPTAAGTFFGAAVGLAAGVAAPPLWLSGKTQERRRQIRSSLPNVLELLSVAIGAGLTPERAIRLVSARAAGPPGAGRRGPTGPSPTSSPPRTPTSRCSATRSPRRSATSPGGSRCPRSACSPQRCPSPPSRARRSAQ